MTLRVPGIRIRQGNERPVQAGDYVLYWMVAYRRASWNYALDRALELSVEHQVPLLVLEGLRCGYAWASDRHHAFVLQGMRDQKATFADHGIAYYPYVEPELGAGKGLLAELSKRAVAIVTDDFPCFMIPRMQAAAAEKVRCRFERVDSNGLLPLAAAERDFTRAHSFRRFLHKTLPAHIAERPKIQPFRGYEMALGQVPAAILRRWPAAGDELLDARREALAALPIDHDVPPVEVVGGETAARVALREFVDERLSLYLDDRNHPERRGTSELSFHLHFGHLSAHEIFHTIANAESWSPERLSDEPTGQREGWWGMSPAAEAYLDELVTWREIGFNACLRLNDYDRYESLPDWARQTLEEHADDEREHVYTLAEFERARTHDPLWNAAQNQLVRDGRIHNYLRMLWGKKILEWTPSPRVALDVMIELNNKYAVDGRDPNSYSGIFWVLGRYDRAWGPERPIYGKIRYMTSGSTRKKTHVDDYIAEYQGEPQGQLGL